MPHYKFIKDAPILAFKITSERFEDIPEIIRLHLGEVDRTKYSSAYLRENIGSVIALQVNSDGAADFYVIGKSTYNNKYKPANVSEVQTKNKKVFAKVAALIPEITSSSDPRLVGALKIASVEMIRMSDLGYEIGREISIQSPWGTQTKPANQDAYLTWDTAQNMYYMINLDMGTGLPSSYIRATDP